MTADTPRLLLASTNPGKLEEMYGLFEGLGLDLTDPAALGLHIEVDETGADYAENAALKARALAAASSLPAVADDTGLEVEALGGAPGLRSRRVAGSDAERRHYLLELLSAHARPWKAVFRCAMTLALPTGGLFTAHGECRGEIIPLARGQGGFGYDPIFEVEGTGRTMAELPLARKNRISHRARAFAGLKPQLLRRLDLAGHAS
ncbi:MAG TPA: RdgB/HAM1 family non-canonical purine NTP pyrophosphatase [Anaerolineales bacterium]|nr:RdgB/HAM1 family non-canonical purine NTP pyrophosphatase [Anaerolineales bacterium]